MSSNKLVKIPLIFKKIEECNLSIIFELQPDNYEVELFIVGGTVRDALLNLSKNLFDLDIVVKPTEATLMITNKISDLNDDETFNIIEFLLNNFMFYPISEEAYPQILKYIFHNKKNEAGEFKFTLLNSAGRAVTGQNANNETVVECLREYSKLMPK